MGEGGKGTEGGEGSRVKWKRGEEKIEGKGVGRGVGMAGRGWGGKGVQFGWGEGGREGRG